MERWSASPLGNERSSRLEVRSVRPRCQPLHGDDVGVQDPVSRGAIAEIPNLRQAARYLPDNIYDAIADFKSSEWTTKLFGEDVKDRYIELKQNAADRCPRVLGTFVKTPEVQYHHAVYNQFLWNMF